MDKKYKIKLKNVFLHLGTVNKHRWIVFKLACRAGIPWRGLVHDLSKYSPTEFWNSVKYYQGGKKSPIPIQRAEEGYSEVWLHHKGRNKHHPEYWFDKDAREKTPIIPYKYTVEMICDKLSASITYQGKNWTNETELKYWREKEFNSSMINENIKKVLDDVFTEISQKGINPVIKSSNLKKIYNKYCGRESREN